jgi:hypothetical protein
MRKSATSGRPSDTILAMRGGPEAGVVLQQGCGLFFGPHFAGQHCTGESVCITINTL